MDLDVCGGIFLPALAEAGYFLQSATLISNFSTAKRLHSKERKQKPFAAQTPPRKRGYVEDFTLKSVNALNLDFYPSNAFSKVTTCYYGAST